MATQLRLLLSLATVLLHDNSIRAEAPTEELCNSSRQILAAVRAIGREQWVYVEKLETGPALRILVERKDADPDDLVKVDIEVHVSALPAVEGDRASVESKCPCLLPSPSGTSPSLLLNGEPIINCPRLPCVVNTSCSLGQSPPTSSCSAQGRRREPEPDRLFDTRWNPIASRGQDCVPPRPKWARNPDAAQAAAVSADAAPGDAAPVAVARGEWEDDAHYVEILYPPDGACLADAAHAYISIAITDKFFTLRGSDALRVALRGGRQVRAAPRRGARAPRGRTTTRGRDGALVPCWQYESDVQVAGGVARAWRAGGSGAAVQGMHDLPRGGGVLPRSRRRLHARHPPRPARRSATPPARPRAPALQLHALLAARSHCMRFSLWQRRHLRPITAPSPRSGRHRRDAGGDALLPASSSSTPRASARSAHRTGALYTHPCPLRCCGACVPARRAAESRGARPPPPPPPPSRTKWTRRVPHPVLIGHARVPPPSTNRTRRVPHPRAQAGRGAEVAFFVDHGAGACATAPRR